MRLAYHPHAEAELIAAARYYENRVATLGSQFLNAADEAVSNILKTPERWPVLEEDVRRYLLLRFPYAIYYRSFPDRIHILAFKQSAP